MSLLRAKKLVGSLWPLVIVGLVVSIFFWKFLFKELLPIPADTIVGMYHPWRDKIWDNFTAGVPFKNFLITDPIRQQFPWRQLATDAFKQGQLPLWNPYSLAGTPLLANFQSAPFYIFNILFFIFNFNAAWGILIFLQPLLAGIFMYLYLRELKLRPVACLFGALSFAFGGFFIAWLEWGTILHSALWLPLILLSIEKIFAWVEKHKNFQFSIFNFQFVLWSGVFLFSLIQSFFAGHLQTFFYVAIFSGIYLTWKLTKAKNNKSKLILLFVICCLLFILITSIQWQPALQFIKLSAREVDQADWQQSGWFIPWPHLLQFFAPDFFGNPTTLNYWGEWNYGEFIGYIGVIPLIFALYAIFFLRTQYSILYTLYFIVFLSFALPTPWAKLPYLLKLPLVSTSQPTRLLLLVDFCLVVLAAVGLNEFLKKKNKTRWLILPLILFGFLWLFVLLTPKIWPHLSWVNNLTVSQRNLILPTAIAFSGAVLIWILSKKIFSRFVLFGLLALAFFDLLRFGWKFTPFVKKDWLFPSTKIIEFLKSDKEIFRIMAVDRRIFPPNFSVVYKLQDVAGYDPLYLLRYGELITASERGEPNISLPFGFNRIITPQNWRSELVDLLNVKYVLSLSDLSFPKLNLVFQEGETRVYENKAVFPRAFLVYDYRVAKNKNEAINLLFEPSLDLRKAVILEEEIDLVLTDQLEEEQVRIVDYQSNLVKLEVISKQSGILVLTDAFYPGWRAFVDNQPTKIYQANYNFRAIIVPIGAYKVKFKYGN